MKNNDIIGIAFLFSHVYDSHLAKIFSIIDCSKYTWYVTNSEILCYNEFIGKADSSIFVPGIYPGNKFYEIINNYKYNIIHARILAIPKSYNLLTDNITDYTAFNESKCELAFLCADGYVDLYIKNQKILSELKKICIQSSYEQISDITIDNDSRTSFFI